MVSLRFGSSCHFEPRSGAGGDVRQPRLQALATSYLHASCPCGVVVERTGFRLGAPGSNPGGAPLQQGDNLLPESTELRGWLRSPT